MSSVRESDLALALFLLPLFVDTILMRVSESESPTPMMISRVSSQPVAISCLRTIQVDAAGKGQ